MQGAPGATAEEVEVALQEVLAREGIPEAPPGSNPLLDWLRSLLEDSGLDGDTVYWLGVGLLAVLTVLLVLRLALRSSRADRTRRSVPELLRSRRIQELLEEAATADSQGDLRLALRLYFQALVVGLGESGELDYRAAWTLREIMERGQPRPNVRRLLEEVLAQVEPRSFGATPTDRGDVDQLRDLCAQHLDAAPAPARRSA